MAANPLVTLANMFAPKPAAPVVVQVAPTPGNLPGIPAIAAIPGNPTSPAAPVVPVEPESALEKHATLWDIDPKAPKPVAPQPLLNVDPTEIAKIASTVDFRSVVTPELAMRMKAGGEDGFAANMEAMQLMTQKVFAVSSEASARMAMEAVTKAEKQFASKIPGIIKRQNLHSSLQENTVLSHPVIAPMVKNLAAQLSVKHPNATEAELTTMANDIFVDLAGLVTKTAEANDTKKIESDQSAKGYDFSDW